MYWHLKSLMKPSVTWYLWPHDNNEFKMVECTHQFFAMPKIFNCNEWLCWRGLHKCLFYSGILGYWHWASYWLHINISERGSSLFSKPMIFIILSWQQLNKRLFHIWVSGYWHWEWLWWLQSSAVSVRQRWMEGISVTWVYIILDKWGGGFIFIFIW